MSNAGLLVGLNGGDAGTRVRAEAVRVGLSADAPGRMPVVGRTIDIDIGGEVAYNITPSLRAVGTINTDFAETEVDQRARQSHALPAVLSGEARLLPRRRDVLRLSVTGVLLAPHRARCQRPAAANHRRRQGDRPGRPLRHRRTLRPDRRGRRRAPGEDFTALAACGGGCCSSRTSAASTPAGTPTTGGLPMRQTRRRRLPAGDRDVPRQQEPERVRLLGREHDDRAMPATARHSAGASSTQRRLGAQRRLPGGAARTTIRRSASRRAANTAATTRSSAGIRGPRPGIRTSAGSVSGWRPDIYTDLDNASSRCDWNMQPCRRRMHSGDIVETSVVAELRATRRAVSNRAGRRSCRPAAGTTSLATQCHSTRPTGAWWRCGRSVEWGTFYYGHRVEYSLGHRPAAAPRHARQHAATNTTPSILWKGSSTPSWCGR